MTSVIEKIGEVLETIFKVVFSPISNILESISNRVGEMWTGLIIGQPFLQCISATIENFIPVNSFLAALTLSLPLMALNFTIAQMRAIQSLININKFKLKWFK